ncbi:MAG: Flagellar hook-associated protein 3 FlgL [Cryobacterium sp.]|jgi:flagellar hook-associated protein 3 FlgL|nr:Flagellar hook-associated protein 3 FlgL [Cryobacterium sp.]
MITRMTTQTMMRSAQRNLQSNMEELAKLQQQATSQKAINRPSDDPTGTADSLRVRGEQRAVDQYRRNADNGNGWLTTIDSALSATNTILNRVRDLTVQGANDGAMSAAAKEAIALELDGLKEDLLKQANTTYLGRSVFAGNSDAPAAFTDAYAFNGADGDRVERRISAGATVRVDADGSAVFGKEDESVFALIKKITDDLRTGPSVGGHLTALDERMKTIVGQHAQIGAQQNQVERAQEFLLAQKGTLEAQRSGIEDIDLGEAILNLKTQEVTYQAALAVTARVLQPTLMDFLR